MSYKLEEKVCLINYYKLRVDFIHSKKKWNLLERIDMKEPEVSLRIALYYIKNGMTQEDVQVSLDGAHIKINGELQFDICSFMETQGCRKIGENSEHWQGAIK